MNQTTKIILGCLAFMVLLIKICRLLHSTTGNYVPNMVVADTAGDNKDSVWTNAYRQTVNQAMYQKADTMLVLENQKRVFADCVTGRFVRLFPQGLAAVPKDKLIQLSQKAFKSCLAEMPDTAMYKWTANRENAIRQQLQKGLNNNAMPPKVKNKYCNCIVDALHKKYANGIKGEISPKYIKSIAFPCAARAYAKP